MFFAYLKRLNASHYINLLSIVYAFILPLSRAGISFFTLLLFIIWIAEGNMRQKMTLIIQNNVIKSLTLFLLFSFVSLVWTEHIYEALNYIKKYWYFLPLFIFLTSLKKEYMPKVLSAFILGMLLSELISYGVFFELWSFKHATVENPSPFMHHIEYSVFLALTGLILLSRFFDAKNIAHKILYAIFFTTVSGNLFLTAGRTGQFAFIVGLFILAMVSFRDKIKALLVSVMLILVVLGVAFNSSQTFHDRVIAGKEDLLNVVNRNDYCTSWGGRVGSWIVSSDIINKNPFLGIGIIDNMKEFHQIIDLRYPKMKCMHAAFVHTHNQFLEVCTQMGIVGLLFFLYIFYSFARLSILNHQYRKIKYAYLTVLIFAFIPEVLFHRQFSMALFAFILGIILAQNRIENES